MMVVERALQIWPSSWLGHEHSDPEESPLRGTFSWKKIKLREGWPHHL